MKRQSIVLILIALVIVAIGVFLSGCKSYKTPTSTPVTPSGEVKEPQTPTQPSETQPAATPETQPTVTPTGEVKEFSIIGRSFDFNPSTITVNRGDTVRITFTSLDIGHNLIIEGYDVGTNIISGGASETIEFVADKPGTFAIYCSVGNHREFGMEGQLIVK